MVNHVARYEEEIRAVIARKERARTELVEAEAEEKELRAALKWFLRLFPSEGEGPKEADVEAPSAPATATRLPNGRDFQSPGLSQVQAAVEILRASGKPMAMRNIVRSMIEGGYPHEDPAKLNKSVRGTLSRMVGEQDIFFKAGHGVYGLLEWRKDEEDTDESESSPAERSDLFEEPPRAFDYVRRYESNPYDTVSSNSTSGEVA